MEAVRVDPERLNPDPQPVNPVTGMAVSRLNELSAAKQALERVASNDKDPAVREAAKNALDSLEPMAQEALVKRAVTALTNTAGLRQVRLSAISTIADILRRGV